MNPKSFIVKLTIPLIIILFVELLTHIVDSSSATYFGTDAVVALGLGCSIYKVIFHLGRGIGSGVNALISNAIGKDNIDNANNISFINL